MLQAIRRSLFCVAVLTTISTASPASVDSCPGYKASNVVNTESSLTADLALNGSPCNVYGTDLTDLRLVVQYQTGKLPTLQLHSSDHLR